MTAIRRSIGAMMVAGFLLAFTLGISLLIWKLFTGSQPTAPPSLTKEWHDQVYGLDDDEVEEAQKEGAI